MLSDKEVKAKFRPRFWAEPDRYYATEVLKEKGFVRGICSKCGRPFWSTDPERTICGDPSCGVEFDFIGKSPAKNKLSYINVWKKFAGLFDRLGYTPIKRYPTVSRWNPTMDYTNASIAAFQPFVISGEVEPQANPLIIPQFCMRFSDIDNVGITGSHNTGFVMIGQHMFVTPDKWDQNKVFRDIVKWLNEGLGLPDNEIIFHEDAWAGGGDFGCCMEFFSRGCEIGNQVYMLYSQTPTGYRDLPIKVLDMGMGQERNAWFSQGAPTIYDAVFPKVLKRIKEKTGLTIDQNLQKNLGPYRGMLNIDESPDIEKAWENIAGLVGKDVNELKKEILPSAAIYSIGEHARTLLVAISDGALPSNVGGGYNLRAILRRSLTFIDKYGWNIELPEVCNWHADEMKEQFPELSENLEDVSNILDVEKKKYEATKIKSKQIIVKLMKEKEIRESKLLELYDSHGIPPDVIKNDAEKIGIHINVPENFYAKIAELHERSQAEKFEKKEEIDLTGVPETEILYYSDYKKTEFNAKVLKIINEAVVLDKTYFYGLSGGQESDKGTINDNNVYEIVRQGQYVIHKVEKQVEKPNFNEGDIVECKIDKERRLQLTKHHTAAHIVNAATRKVLGNHINQAGAYKSVDKARLDVTHYESLSDKELKEIEKESNKIISSNIPVEKSFMSRRKAEDKYGMRIYQGPAVPGKNLRIVSIPNIDTEACGGTHVDNTSEIEKIIITRAVKISDSVVRIEFKAGNAAKQELSEERKLVKEMSEILNINEAYAYEGINDIFEKWKRSKKILKKLKDEKYLERIKKGEAKIEIPKLIERKEKEKKELTDTEISSIITETVKLLKTQPSHIPKTLNRFKTEFEENVKNIRKTIA